MANVLGTYVPELGRGAAVEICHSFVYRWLIARGRITGNYPDPLIEMTTVQARRILFPTKGQPARVAGNIRVTMGSIIGFWDAGGNLQHSMIAVSPTSWFGANNTGCFGVPGGRRRMNNVDLIVHGPDRPRHFGWIGAGNQWQAQYAVLTVTYKLPPMKRF